MPRPKSKTPATEQVLKDARCAYINCKSGPLVAFKYNDEKRWYCAFHGKDWIERCRRLELKGTK